jgi:IclR family transcriptional regulator, acetate operon repressor
MPKHANGQPTPLIQSLDRGLAILEAVGKSNDPVSLGELTGILRIDRSSAFRLANTLRQRGFLVYPTGRKDYILGPSIWRLSRQYDWSNMLIRVSHEHLKLLASQTNETAHLAVRVGERALFIDHAAANHVIAVTGQTGELLPLYCTAHGKALLADSTKRELKSIFGSRSLRSFTPSTITALDEVSKVCGEINAQGFATDDAEYIDGVRCVAAPIRAQGGAVIGSIGISAPSQRFPQERYQICGAQVSEVARQISVMLTHQTQDA